LRWDEIGENRHQDLLHWYRALVTLRAEALTGSAWPTDDVVVRFDEQARWLALRVKEVSALFNFGRTALTLEVPTLDLGISGLPSRARRMLVSGERIATTAATVSLPAAATLVWQH
jgi:hypothetical protein